jgi:pyridoxal phosphate enzyme (YggS family)
VNQNVDQTLELVRKAAVRVNRNPQDVRVMVAAKYGDTQTVLDIVGSGISIVGENHVQNAKRWMEYPDRKFQLHMIGHLQTNKINQALQIFDWFDTIDSVKLVHELDSRATKPIPSMIEVNIGGEEQKTGVSAKDFEALADSMIKSDHLELSGVFTMAPVDADEKMAENVFLEADRLAANLEQRLSRKMERCYGMSGDFETAIACGSTMLRLGRILFGGDHGHR